MTWLLFIVGLMTSLGCGWNVIATDRATWQHLAVWLLGGCIGAGLMVLAILLNNGWMPS